MLISVDRFIIVSIVINMLLSYANIDFIKKFALIHIITCPTTITTIIYYLLSIFKEDFKYENYSKSKRFI